MRRTAASGKRTAVLAGLVAACMLLPGVTRAQQVTRQVIGAGAGRATTGQAEVAFSMGEPVVGKREAGAWLIELWSGFWYPTRTQTAVPDPVIRMGPTLIGNFPNPFTPRTEICFTVGPESRPARLRIFDCRGRAVRTLVNELASPGLHRVIWRGNDDGGRTVASGIYFYRLEIGGEHFTRRMLLLR